MVKAVIFDMYETLITLYDCPPYFGAQMAADAGITEDKFQELWHPSESDRSIGKIRFEEIIEKILRINDCFSEEVLSMIVKKRTLAREEAFVQINNEIIPMLEGLKEKGMLIGLISNCFSVS